MPCELNNKLCGCLREGRAWLLEGARQRDYVERQLSKIVRNGSWGGDCAESREPRVGEREGTVRVCEGVVP